MIKKHSEALSFLLVTGSILLLYLAPHFYHQQFAKQVNARSSNGENLRSALSFTDILPILNRCIKSGTYLNVYDNLYYSPNFINIETNNQTGDNYMEQAFYILDITDSIFERINSKSFKSNSTIKRSDLKYLSVLHYGFDGKIHSGELVVNKKIAEKVISIFKELYNIKYPIEKMCLIDDYNADDEASMADNNSSCFNYRNIDSSSKLSNHSLGTAIDINPLYNPYVRSGKGDRNVLPADGKPYADRSRECPYYIKKGDACYNIFKKYGFTWGGDWKSSKDYQHFEIEV